MKIQFHQTSKLSLTYILDQIPNGIEVNQDLKQLAALEIHLGSWQLPRQCFYSNYLNKNIAEVIILQQYICSVYNF